jgi:hypothetical protein
LVGKTATVKNKNKWTSTPKRNRILIIGDSHVSSCPAEILTDPNGRTFNVMGSVMPVPRLEHIKCLPCRERSQLHHNGFVNIWGGANDINRDESNTGFRHIRKFTLQNTQSNAITMTARHRCDLQVFCCINREIQVYNRKLHTMLKNMYNANIF